MQLKVHMTIISPLVQLIMKHVLLKYLNTRGVGEARSKSFKQQVLLSHCILKVCKRQPAIMVMVHLLQCDLHQVFDSLIRVLLNGLSDEAVLQHMKHLLPGDVVVTVQVVHMKAVFYFFIQGPTKKNRQPLNPLFHTNKAVIVFVKCPEDSIHDHVVSHPKAVVQDAPEPASVQAAGGSSRDCRLPQQDVKLSDKAGNFCFIEVVHLF